MWSGCPTSAPLDSRFPSPWRDQVQVAPWLGVGVCVHFLASSLAVRLVWSCAGPVRAAIVSVCEFPDASALLCLETSWSRQSVCSPFPVDPWASRGGIYTCHSGLSTKVSNSCMVSSYRSLCLPPSTRGSFSAEGSGIQRWTALTMLLGVARPQLLKTLRSFCVHGLCLLDINENKKFK